jgi:ubiquinone/menaquinone biosynthesis C-methylase UbiE
MDRDRLVGYEHIYEFQPGFHERLFRNWPEPREQLHAGGWAATRCLVDKLGIRAGTAVLDVCCGEGGTAIWMAQNLGAHVVGIDILGNAVEAAGHEARKEGIQSSCSLIRANLFSLPFKDETFDIVIGQDPDGLPHVQRVFAFQEIFRVLRKGGQLGIHHWIPGVGVPQSVIQRFDQVNVAVGYPSHGEVHAAAYIQAMQAASFRDIQVLDKSEMYSHHMRAIRNKALTRGEEVDSWTAAWLDLAEEYPFGVMLFGLKS